MPAKKGDPCSHCEEPLNYAQEDEGWKSCPNCSTDNEDGEHVFRPRSDFGHTAPRKTGHQPDGIQSWCNGCRERGGVFSGKSLMCSSEKMEEIRND